MPKVIDVDSSKLLARTPFGRLPMLYGKTLVERSFPMNISAGPFTLVKHTEGVAAAIEMLVTTIDNVEIRQQAFVDFKHYGIIS
ncbi:hypothetical protein MVEG_09553 [Podila verticillata NRRL 6337]|nr:hypothetical protein MVEG_09553 [Podila verticillata NRRL 6337]